MEGNIVKDKRWTTDPTPPKKDLIDLVREGHPINIYESKPLLQEGDVLEDWEGEEGNDCRVLVGKLIGIRLFGYLISKYACPYCSTLMHYIRVENRKSRKGRDGKTYIVIVAAKENDYTGRVCPLCEYQNHREASYDY